VENDDMLLGSGRRLPPFCVIAVVAVALLGFSSSAQAERRPVRQAQRAPDPTARGSAALATKLAPQAARYRAQSLAWTPCIDKDADPGLPTAYYRLQCSTLLAPLDWSDPDAGPQLRLAVSRLPAGDSPAKGVLFTNPGGPGAEGLDLPLLFVSDNRKKLLQSQDIYGIDVRGTGLSTNVTCGGAPELSLDPRDRRSANLDLLLDASDLAARACHVAGADLIDHITTDQTVRDLDLLRSVVEAPKINWLGFSAGTWLGAQYATAYPQNVGHMVLDSNVDFTRSWQAALALQPMGFERRFRSDFAGWVAKYQSVYGLGASSDAVLVSYERIRAGIGSDLPVDSASALDEMIAGSLYAKDLFPLAAQVLADLDTVLSAQRAHARTAGVLRARARISAAVPMLRRRIPNAQPFSGDASDAAFLAITCNDTPWTAGRSASVASSATLGAQSPLIGWSTIEQPCRFWDRPDVSTPVPTGAGAPPVLMVQSEHDPATPIEGAAHAAAGFAGARMLTVTNEGDHGLYAGGNTCVDKAVEAFIVAGTLPAQGASCAGQPLPDPVDTGSFGADSFSSRSVGSVAVPAAGTNPLLALRLLSGLAS
jgi:pimeloyl-ACP methyl ester carboxylesterase